MIFNFQTVLILKVIYFNFRKEPKQPLGHFKFADKPLLADEAKQHGELANSLNRKLFLVKQNKI
jgi:hypothetical protein